MTRNQRYALPEQVAGLLFDAGDVLYDATPGRRRLLRVLAQMGLHTQYGCFFRIWERNFLREVYCGRQTYLEAFRSLLRSFGFTEPQIEEVAVAAGVHRRTLECPDRLLPGVRETLARSDLAHLSLGVLTNATVPSVDVERQLVDLGLGGRFRWIFSSIDLGIALPQRATYCAAVEAMGLTPQQVAFVGHDSDELAGAAAAGLSTIAVNYLPDAVADAYLENFYQLASLVDRRAVARMAG